MIDLEYNYNKKEIDPYIKYGKKIERKSTNDLVLIKWLEEFILENNLLNNKEIIGVLGSLIFFLYNNNQIKTKEDCKGNLSKILEYYKNKINFIQQEIPVKIQPTLKHLLLIKKYKTEFLENQQLTIDEKN